MQKRLQKMEEECKKIEETRCNLVKVLAACREEKHNLYGEFEAKMPEMKKSGDFARRTEIC
jgi:hypothetical protein